MSEKTMENPLEYLGSKLRRQFSRFDGRLFLVIFALALLVHMYMFTNKFINHDDVGGIYAKCTFGLSSGRWLLQPMTNLAGNFSSPWFDGIVGALFLSMAVVFIAKVLGFRRFLPAVLMGACLVSFPAIASTYSYMFCASQYLFAMAFCALGAWLIRSGKWPCMLAGSLAIAFAMGCYQAYFCLAAVLLLMACGLDLLEDRFGGDWKGFFLSAVKQVFFLALGMVLYMVILRLCLWAAGSGLVGYQGIDTMGQVSASQLVGRVVDAYKAFAKFALNRSGVFHRSFPLIFLACCGTAGIVALGAILGKKLYRRPVMMGFLALILLLFPMACCLVYLMVDTATSGVHHVMLFPTVMPLILPAVALDRITFAGVASVCRGRGKQDLCLLLAVLLLAAQGAACYENIYITNRAYFAMDFTYENVYAYYTKLTAKLELQEGYAPGVPVAFVGTATMDNYIFWPNMTGVVTGNSALNIYSRSHFLMYYLGAKYNFVPDARKAEIQKTEAFAQMPCYPAAGSIQTIDGVITVKFS